ncbi:hypothetical protein [Thermocoleostomius sinensis]|uniref:DUF4926 domain-containing protein n=1 Tax=Thermocoleostomius sinensis A174 TaxID=2016057 RepID=A0A9E9C7R1_9CYAN|nr:hypothetical protein [Thermocoleostomius sinensis]WAL59493.1 hypothetical protein OXH18_20315 [Thermocoleostomius sinensis A174]
MATVDLFQWIVVDQDVPNILVKAGDRGIVVDCLPSNETQPELGYVLEVFKDGETLDVASVPVS